jgi:hypothetical protein
VKRTGGNKSWDYMFTSWKCYAEEFPDKKNNVCIETHGRLNNWVKEQRRKFVNNILTDQRFQQLRSEGFDFAPRKGTGLDRKLPAKREVNEMINASVKDPPEDCRDVPSAKPPSEDIPVSSIVATVEVVGSEPNEAINASVKIPPEDCRDVLSAKPPSEVIGVTARPLSEAKGIIDLPSNTVSSGRKDDDIPVSSTVAAVEVVGSEPNEAINASVNIPQEDCRDVLSAKPPSEVIGVTPRPLSEAKGIFDLPSNTVSSGRKDDDIPVSSIVATVEVVGSEPNEVINASVNIPQEDCQDVLSAKPPSEVIGVTPRPLSEAKGIFDLPSNTVSSGRKDDGIPVSSTVATVEVVGSEPNEAINASVNVPPEDCRNVPLVDDDSVTLSQSIQPIGDTFKGNRKRLPKKAKAVVPLQNERILRSASVKENLPKKPQLIDKQNKPVINVDEIDNPPPSSDVKEALFQFPPGISAEDKLELLLSSPYVNEEYSK